MQVIRIFIVELMKNLGYRSAAAENGVKSIAFCCISTGVFRFPAQKAAHIAVKTTEDWKNKTKSAMKIVFTVFKDEDFAIYNTILSNPSTEDCKESV